MKISLPLSACLALTAVSVSSAQQRPAIRQLGAVTAKSAETFTGIGGIRALGSGSVLVNDPAARRVVLFNPQLSQFTIVADSTSATANAYGGRFASLIPYRGDSTLFIDASSVSMLVIDGAGKVARVMAIPRAEDAAMIGGGMGSSVFDPSGRIIYRAGGGRIQMGGRAMATLEQSRAGGAVPTAFAMPEPPDSAFILAVNLATRKVDTLGYIRTPKMKFDVKRDDRGGIQMSSLINPLPVVDDWAVTSDGAVAFVRGRDYHVDWLNPDGTRTSSSKIPFEWRRLSDEDKVAFIDSVKAARERMGANAPIPLGGVGAQGAGGAPMQEMRINIGSGPPGAEGAPNRSNIARGGPAPTLAFVPASDLPDNQPAFFAGSTRADNDGNLWIRTIPTTSLAGGPVYDVINRKGELVERVQVPSGRTIVGFGTGGAVYLVHRDGTTARLERASVR